MQGNVRGIGMRVQEVVMSVDKKTSTQMSDGYLQALLPLASISEEQEPEPGARDPAFDRPQDKLQLALVELSQSVPSSIKSAACGACSTSNCRARCS